MADSEVEQGGRIFFSNIGRSMETEDEIILVSVGIDIGSSTSHLVFSRIVLERLDTRYMIVERTLLHQSDVLLTPYSADDMIDAAALGDFIAAQYEVAGVTAADVDTGALILTGVAVRRRNARAIGELFSAQTGKFVVVSAGDSLEATLAAFGSGAVARSSRRTGRILNVDIGGGTSKLAICEGGAIQYVSAIDIGARVIAFDQDRRIVRLEEAGSYFGKAVGLHLAVGDVLSVADALSIADRMAGDLFDGMQGLASASQEALYRLPALPMGETPVVVTVSGGVSEFFYAESEAGFTDLGPQLASCLRSRLERWGPSIERPDQGIRATVVGASQYTVQVSGSTIFVRPLTLLPIRNIPVVKPRLVLGDVIDPAAVAAAVREALSRMDLTASEGGVALYYTWTGSATYWRLDGFCRGILAGFAQHLARGLPLVLVGEGDVGGLVGIHCHSELGIADVVSIDGIELDEFDFIDIGAMLETSGAVPVVIKSLVFPTHALGPGVAIDA